MKRKSTFWKLKNGFQTMFVIVCLAIILGLINLPIAKATGNYSQSARLTVQLVNVTIDQVFREIEKQSEYIVFYKDKEIDLDQKVTVNFKNVTVDKILDEVLKNTKATYKIIDRQIVILSKLAAYDSKLTMLQKIRIKGAVTDDKSGAPIPGVNIIIEGTTEGTITDLDGNYELEVPSSNVVLVFSFIGYLTQKINVEGKTFINIRLEQDAKAIEEVVVVGYGTQKKSDLTGAVASVSGDKIKEIPVSTVAQALQGKAAGVSIVQNTGVPGGSVSIQIRGISSINGSDPLIIVDGVPSSLNGLNPDDIESVEVLKDASSSAIYGASGGNGVILVSTKKGKSGKTVTTFNYYKGWQKPWKKMDVCNSQQYVKAMNDLALVSGREPFSTRPDTFPNYDWQDIMFRTAVMENYDISVSGGNDKSTFMVSSSYTKQDGILHNSDYQRFTARINSDHKISPILKVGENVTFVNTKNNGYDEWQFTQEYNTPIIGILQMYPYISPYDANGKWSVAPNGGGNPKVAQDVMNQQRYGYNTGGNVYAEINPFKGFTFTSRINGYINFGEMNNFKNVYDYSPRDQRLNNSIDKSMDKTFGWNLQNFANYNQTLFNDHNFALMAGMEAGYSKYLNMTGTRENLINESEEMRYFDASQNDTLKTQFVKGGANESSGYAYFGRLNYDYKGKYLFTVNVRKDYSSRFGPGNRSGLFPSFSAGWKFSEEAFVKNFGFLNFGKIRAGWGKTGANAPANYAYYASVNSTLDGTKYIFDRKTSISGAAPVKMPNREIRWESMVMTNIGLDLGFFGDKITFTADYFEKYNDGMLLYRPQPSLAGIYQDSEVIQQLGGDARPLVNVGSIKNTGFEFSIGVKKQQGELKASFDLNITLNKNEVVDLKGDSLPYGTIGVNLSPITLTKEGYPMGQFYGFLTDGLFSYKDTSMIEGKVVVTNQPHFTNSAGTLMYAQPKAQPGDFKFKDINGDGRITDLDKTLIGNPFPKIVLGFSCNLAYKGFDMTMFFEGKFGSKIFNGTKFWLMQQDIGSNRSPDVLNQYREPSFDENGNVIDPGNINTTLPRLDPKGDNQNFTRVSDYYVEDGSYLRLKNLQIGYTIPDFITKKVGIENVRFYVGAKNLLTFTKYTGFDPEIGQNVASGQGLLLFGTDKAATYPQCKMFLVGANLRF